MDKWATEQATSSASQSAVANAFRGFLTDEKREKTKQRTNLSDNVGSMTVLPRTTKVDCIAIVLH